MVVKTVLCKVHVERMKAEEILEAAYKKCSFTGKELMAYDKDPEWNKIRKELYEDEKPKCEKHEFVGTHGLKFKVIDTRELFIRSMTIMEGRNLDDKLDQRYAGPEHFKDDEETKISPNWGLRGQSQILRKVCLLKIRQYFSRSRNSGSLSKSVGGTGIRR